MATPKKPGNPQPQEPTGYKDQRRDFGGHKLQDVTAYTQHADEVRAVAGGKDIVEQMSQNTEQRPAAFDRQELQVIRSWVDQRPLEPKSPAAALIAYPRMWMSKRGRYAKFSIQGSGMYGILRARPTF